jgi:hypothetical protein
MAGIALRRLSSLLKKNEVHWEACMRTTFLHGVPNESNKTRALANDDCPPASAIRWKPSSDRVRSYKPTAFLPTSGSRTALVAECRTAIRAVRHGDVPALLGTIQPKMCLDRHKPKAAAIAILLFPRSRAQALKGSSQRIDNLRLAVGGFNGGHVPIPFDLCSRMLRS